MMLFSVPTEYRDLAVLSTVIHPRGPPEGPPGPPKGPKWVAQVGGPKLGPSPKFGTQTNPPKKIKIKIRVAQNVGKVWISRKK